MIIIWSWTWKRVDRQQGMIYEVPRLKATFHIQKSGKWNKILSRNGAIRSPIHFYYAFSFRTISDLSLNVVFKLFYYNRGKHTLILLTSQCLQLVITASTLRFSLTFISIQFLLVSPNIRHLIKLDSYKEVFYLLLNILSFLTQPVLIL